MLGNASFDNANPSIKTNTDIDAGKPYEETDSGFWHEHYSGTLRRHPHPSPNYVSLIDAQLNVISFFCVICLLESNGWCCFKSLISYRSDGHQVDLIVSPRLAPALDTKDAFLLITKTLTSLILVGVFVVVVVVVAVVLVLVLVLVLLLLRLLLLVPGLLRVFLFMCVTTLAHFFSLRSILSSIAPPYLVTC